MLTSIIDSIQYPILIKDNEIKGMQLSCLDNGTPESWTGGFAVVFHFKSANKDYAFRCLHTPVSEDIETRWFKVSTFLTTHKCNYLCEFQYKKMGLIANGNSVPTIKMAWVEGMTLDRFLHKNRSNVLLLKKLAENFLHMTKNMHSIHFAHGDLQHENILVDKNANIMLIDYDSAYVPTMSDFNDVIQGKRNYQHPKRFKNKFSSEKIDYFSQLIIYLSLLAYSENPLLISKDIISEESLLFKEQDFESISSFTHCVNYNKIKNLSPTCQSLLDILDDYINCKSINELTPFYMHEKFHESETLSKFCTNCGYKFASEIYNYCIKCGHKRYKI